MEELDEHQSIQSQVLLLLLFSYVTLNKSRPRSLELPLSRGENTSVRGPSVGSERVVCPKVPVNTMPCICLLLLVWLWIANF